jgi:two-component system, sensor histidine kinase PdtaS
VSPSDYNLKCKALAFDSLAQHSLPAVALLDHNLNYIFVNQAFADFNGFNANLHFGKNVSQFAGSPLISLIPFCKEKTELSNTDQESNQFRVFSSEKRPWLCRLLALSISDDKTAVAAIAVPEQSDEALQKIDQQNFQTLRQVLDNLFAFVGILTPEGVLIDANRSPLEAAGIELSDVIQQKFWDCYWWTHSAAERDRIKTAIVKGIEGHTSRFDITAQMKNKIMILDFMLAPMFDAAGKLCYLIASAIDISDRTQSEAQLRESELRFRRVFDSAADGLISVDQFGCITMINPRSLEMFGYAAEELIGQPIEILVPSELTSSHRRHRETYLQHPSTRRMSERTELYAKRKDGSLFPVDIGLTHLNISGDARVLATVTDITAQKLAQQKLQLIVDEKSHLLSERTALLNEVHHRVKNNLQIISSLLNLQARSASPEVKEALTESQLRVRTMALTHQLLYEKRDFSSITLGAYLQQLCQLVRQSLSQQCLIEFDFSAVDENLILQLEQAIPCGLFVNEVLTNAIKHAFPGRTTGLIRLELSHTLNNKISLNIIDNGIGLPTNVELNQQTSLGFQLIPTFVAQLRGELTLQRKSGTGFFVQFPAMMEAS